MQLIFPPFIWRLIERRKAAHVRLWPPVPLWRPGC